MAHVRDDSEGTHHAIAAAVRALLSSAMPPAAMPPTIKPPVGDSLMERIESYAGEQIALLQAVKTLLMESAFRSSLRAHLETQLEVMRADLLASCCSERKLQAFESAAEALVDAATPG